MTLCKAKVPLHVAFRVFQQPPSPNELRLIIPTAAQFTGIPIPGRVRQRVPVRRGQGCLIEKQAADRHRNWTKDGEQSNVVTICRYDEHGICLWLCTLGMSGDWSATSTVLRFCQAAVSPVRHLASLVNSVPIR